MLYSIVVDAVVDIVVVVTVVVIQHALHLKCTFIKVCAVLQYYCCRCTECPQSWTSYNGVTCSCYMFVNTYQTYYQAKVRHEVGMHSAQFRYRF